MMHYAFLLLLLWTAPLQALAQAGEKDYLKEIKTGLQKEWPHNRTINLVFHGHSVPSGYVNTPNVNTLGSYPHLVLKALKERYPHAVINVIVTAIGGENSISGEKRFRQDVLPHRPDVLFIDYALNDRGVGLEKARAATESMIKMAQAQHIPVILLTPSPDQRVNLLQPGNELEQFANQIRDLSKQFNTGLADSYARFRELAASGGDIKKYMSWVNHPNEAGHQVIADEIMKWFR